MCHPAVLLSMELQQRDAGLSAVNLRLVLRQARQDAVAVHAKKGAALIAEMVNLSHTASMGKLHPPDACIAWLLC